jgi:hypothetical protein
MSMSDLPEFPRNLARIVRSMHEYKITVYVEHRVGERDFQRRPKFTPQPGLMALVELDGSEWAALSQFAREMGATFFRIVHPVSGHECRAQFSIDETGRGTPYEEGSSSTTTLQSGRPTVQTSRHLVRIVLHTLDEG